MGSAVDSTATAGDSVGDGAGWPARELTADRALDTVKDAAMTELYVATSQGSYSWFRQDPGWSSALWVKQINERNPGPQVRGRCDASACGRRFPPRGR